MVYRNPHNARNQAFTLIELLTVIAIIAVLTAILFPVAGTVREQARATDCMSNLHQLWVSANVYREDEGAFPSALLGYPEGIIQDPNNNNVLIHVPWQPGLPQVGLPNGNPNRRYRWTRRTSLTASCFAKT